MTTVYTNETGIMPGAEACSPHKHAICWASIFGGAVATIAIGFTLMILEAAFGLTISSPWANHGMSAGAVTINMIIAMIIVQWLSAALGGYLTGRLRSRWVGTHTDEVFFRDTAHGFLTWCVATLVMITILGSAVSAVVSGGAKAGGMMAAAGAAAEAQRGPGPMMGPHGDMMDPMAYTVDTMFRSQRPTTDINNPESRMEVTRILGKAAKDGSITAEDKTYLGSVIAARAGVSQAEGEARVDRAVSDLNDAKAKAKDAADKARKASATLALFTFLSLVIGAFIAAVSAAMGGRCRDDVKRYTTIA
jgi:hypothetical protein